MADTSKAKDALDWSTGLIVAPQVPAALMLWNLCHSFGHYKADGAIGIPKGVLAPMARTTIGWEGLKIALTMLIATMKWKRGPSAHLSTADYLVVPKSVIAKETSHSNLNNLSAASPFGETIIKLCSCPETSEPLHLLFKPEPTVGYNSMFHSHARRYRGSISFRERWRIGNSTKQNKRH